jgi:glutathione S-transferase
MITVTAFSMVPPFAQGLVRDLRVRWALEEAGLPYDVRLISLEDKRAPDYMRRQPFGQVPVLQDGALTLFESGAIVLHVGAKSEALLPAEPVARARATAWVFAALNSIEIAVTDLASIDLFYADEDWAKLRRPSAEAFLMFRLGDLAGWLGEDDYLEGDRFTAGDLMMTSVLRILRHTDILARFPNLAAYKARCEDRPGFQRALEGQMSAFRAAA